MKNTSDDLVGLISFVRDSCCYQTYRIFDNDNSKLIFLAII